MVRLVKDDGTSEIITYASASQLAENLELDLIFIAGNSNPPVCKILDEGKYLYELKRKEKEQKKKQRESAIELKEIKFKSRIDSHDLETKTNTIKRFLSEGKQVKVTILVKGRENAHPDIPRNLAQRISEAIDIPLPAIKFEGTNLSFIVESIKQ